METSNAPACNCKRTACPRHGDCAACIAHHDRLKRRPYCFYHRQDAAKSPKRRGGRKDSI